MATDAARVNVKAREAKQEGVRQIDHRTERYQQFKGRRSTVLPEDLQARRNRCFQAMLRWLEAQALVNAEEGTPREVHAAAGLVNLGAVREGEWGDSIPGSGGEAASNEPQRLITSFFVVGR